MTTLVDLISLADAEALRAKRDDLRARAASEASRADVELRFAWEDASQVRRDAEQRAALLRWEADLDRWITGGHRAAQGDGYVDPGLEALADGDGYVLAALHLKRAGATVPAGWRSPAGNGI